MSVVDKTTDSTIMDIYHLVYVSRITSRALASASTLSSIAEVSIKNNKANNLSGVLCYGNGYFVQCVEGSEQALTQLKNRILVDDLNKDMQVLDFSAIAERCFSDWPMRSIALEPSMMNDANFKALIPMEPYSWNFGEWRQFLNILQHYYKEQEMIGKLDVQPPKYSTLGITVSRIVSKHQAFFLIQTVLGALIIMALFWLMLSNNFL